jgi:hypothetical protein
MASRHGELSCLKILLKWIGIEGNATNREEGQERIIENATLGAMAGGHDHVLEILPRLNSSNISRMLCSLPGHPSLLITSIDWGKESVAQYFLRNYTFDLSVRDDFGSNALIIAAMADMPEVVRLILEQRADLLNVQDNSGRTPISWAAETSMDSVHVLLGHKDINPELRDRRGFAPIAIMMRGFTLRKLAVVLSIVPFLENGINEIVDHGRTLLHVLICSFCPTENPVLPDGRGCRVGQMRDSIPIRLKDFYRQADDRPSAINLLRQALLAMPVSAHDIRSSRCGCGISTIFLAVSTGDVGLVQLLLELYPELVNDKLSDGRSPLDVARCFS